MKIFQKIFNKPALEQINTLSGERTNLVRSKVRVRFWRDLGRCFQEEREKRRKTTEQISRYANMPRWIVDKIELGRCQRIGQAFKLAAYYGKKISVRLED